LLPVLLLSLSAVIWGSTFFLAKGLVSHHSPLSVLMLRFALAGLAMWLVRPGCLRGLSRQTWLRAVMLGGVYGAAQVPHYYGLRLTSASTAGFLVGTYVVVTPVLAFVLLRRRPSTLALVGVASALAGLAVFSWPSPGAGAGSGGSSGLGLGPGELLCLAAAALYALMIVAMGAWSLPGQAWALTTVQMLTMAVVMVVPASVQGIDVPTSAADWWVLAYLALGAGALGVGIQTWAQARLEDTQAAVIMSGEPMWAALLAVTFTAEQWSGRLVVGGALLLAANVVTALSHAGGRSR
jgi:drug/metabolite transporter (DMT)-like permease